MICERIWRITTRNIGWSTVFRERRYRKLCSASGGVGGKDTKFITTLTLLTTAIFNPHIVNVVLKITNFCPYVPKTTNGSAAVIDRLSHA